MHLSCTPWLSCTQASYLHTPSQSHTVHLSQTPSLILIALSHSLSLSIGHCAFPLVVMPDSHCLLDGQYTSQLHTMHLYDTPCLDDTPHLNYTVTPRVSVAGSVTHCRKQCTVCCSLCQAHTYGSQSHTSCCSVAHSTSQWHTICLSWKPCVTVAHSVSVMHCMSVVHHKS